VKKGGETRKIEAATVKAAGGELMKVEKTKYPGIYKIGINYYIDFYGNGKRHRKVVGPNLDMAVEEKTRMKRKNKAGKYHIVERMQKTTFDKLLELYKKEDDAKDYVLQFETTYLSHFEGQKLASITQSDLFAFRDKVKATPRQFGGTRVTDSTVNRCLAGLRRIFNFAVLRQYLEESPFPKVPKSGLFYSEKKGLRRFFKEEQMVEIVQASPDWLRPIILTNYYTGLRQGELLSLKRKWVDLEEGIIYLPSTKTLKDPTGMGEKIAMQKELIDLFKGLPKRSEYVFSQRDGKPFKQWHVYKAFKRVLKAVGIDPKQFSWKELRHTTGSLMHLKGSPVLAIKDQLRHTTSRTTESFYIGSDLDYQREQIERLTNSKFRASLKSTPEDSEKTVKKEAVLNTLQEVPPIASA
jgi:integrase